MVHPLMRQSPDPAARTSTASTSESSKDADTDAEHIAGRVIDMLSRLHVLVIGPGLGRDPLMQATVARVVRAARERDLPLVMDADALLLVQNDPSLVKGYKNVILTPNVVEFSRLCKAIGIDEEKITEEGGETGKVEALARALDGVTIIQKGGKDYISNGSVTLVVDLEGGKKRSGGQGDTLTGSIATFLGWRKAYLDGLWERREETLAEGELIGLAAYGGSAITRVCFTQQTPFSLESNRMIGMLEACLCKDGPESASE
jgi:ATP-dependent NAD(P)H-hydrate dehydratase